MEIGKLLTREGRERGERKGDKHKKKGINGKQDDENRREEANAST